MGDARLLEAPRPVDIEAEGRLLDAVLSGYEGGGIDPEDPKLVSGLRSVCDELLEEGRQESQVEALLRGVLIDAEALRKHISESPALPTETGRPQALNLNQQRFISREMTKAVLPYIRSDGTYDLACGAERAEIIQDQLCAVGYDSDAIRLLAIEALAAASESISAMADISPETFNAQG